MLPEIKKPTTDGLTDGDARQKNIPTRTLPTESIHLHFQR
jgi:hypothetical protein